MRHGILALALASVLATGPVGAQSIGIFFDPLGTTCSVQLGANTPFHAYILVQLAGAAAGGVSGAEFRLTGFPTQVIGFFTAAANSFSIGGPAVSSRDWIAFSSCVTGSGGLVTLYTADCFAVSAPPTSLLQIQAASPVGNPFYPCPLVTLCDYPTFTKVCVTGGQAVINGSCTVEVEPATWSRVKNLYD